MVAERARVSAIVNATAEVNRRDVGAAVDNYARVLYENHPTARPSDWAYCGAQANSTFGGFSRQEAVRTDCLYAREFARQGR
jgi:hypothetical protein